MEDVLRDPEGTKQDMTYKVDRLKTTKRKLECYIPGEATASGGLPTPCAVQSETPTERESDAQPKTSEA